MAVGGVYRANDVTPNQSLGIIGSKVWRMAALSAIGIGTSWSLQGLWAAPWLRDVARLDRASVVDHLSVMAFVVCASALLLGTLTKSLQRRGIKTEWVLAGTLGLSMGAQAALLFGCRLPSYLLWSLIAAAAARPRFRTAKTRSGHLQQVGVRRELRGAPCRGRQLWIPTDLASGAT
jgi:hypothetical protein